MSLPNLPDINPIEGLDAEQTALLILASIALEEISIAHILNAEGEKLQAALGTLELPNGTALGPLVDDLQGLLDINTNINRTLRTLVKKEMLLQFKLEDTLDFLGTLTPPPPVELCACQLNADIETTADVVFNGTTVTGADVTLNTDICPNCTPEDSQLTLSVTALALPILGLTVDEFTSILCGENNDSLILEGIATATGVVAGLVDFVITFDEVAGTVTIVLTQNDVVVFSTTLVANFDIEPCPPQE